MSTFNSTTRHTEEQKQSQRILELARQKAAQTRSYSSQQWRERARLAYREHTEGYIAQEWQLDVAEAIELGVDTLAIAATGKGKKSIQIF